MLSCTGVLCELVPPGSLSVPQLWQRCKGESGIGTPDMEVLLLREGSVPLLRADEECSVPLSREMEEFSDPVLRVCVES